MGREMKDSGIDWLKEIPRDWGISKIGQNYSLRTTKVSDSDYEPLSVTYRGIVPQLENVAKTDAHDARKLVRKDDFAINSRSDRRGACGIADRDGSVSLINIVLKPKDNMVARYYELLFHTVQFGDEFYKWGHGIVNDLWTTRWQDMKNISIPVPPLSEQEGIANYLDIKTEEIDAAIHEAKSLINKYKAYKQSLITKAVTKGLNPDVKMKDSGIEWIGQIPEHWGIERIKYLFSFGKGLNITKADLTEHGSPVISYGQIHSKTNTGVSIKKELVRFVPKEITSIHPGNQVHIGDFIFADTSEDIEGCGNCVYIDKEGVYAGYHSLVLYGKGRDNKYLAYLFKSDIWRIQVRSKVSGIKVFSITQSVINKCTVILPPLSEQQQIANYLDTKCSQIDTIVSQKEQLITQLQEYKKSIIFEYVTGKKEVPNG